MKERVMDYMEIALRMAQELLRKLPGEDDSVNVFTKTELCMRYEENSFLVVFAGGHVVEVHPVNDNFWKWEIQASVSGSSKKVSAVTEIDPADPFCSFTLLFGAPEEA